MDSPSWGARGIDLGGFVAFLRELVEKGKFYKLIRQMMGNF